MEEKKISVGARTGYFFLALVPFISFWIIQFASMIIALLPNMVELISTSSSGNTQELIYSILPATVLIMHIIIIVVFGLWYFFGRERKSTHKFKMSARTLLSTSVLAFAMSFMSNSIVLIQQKFFPSVVEEYTEMADLSGFGKSILTLIAASLLAPIGEELICRGVTLMYARKSVPFWIANTLQALIFALMHANWVQGTYAFIIGIILGYSVKKYNSVIPSMIIHFIVNTIASYVFSILFIFIPVNIGGIIVTSTVSIIAVTASLYLMKCEKVNDI